jgi:hypothetical protein
MRILAEDKTPDANSGCRHAAVCEDMHRFCDRYFVLMIACNARDFDRLAAGKLCGANVIDGVRLAQRSHAEAL